MHRKIRLLIVEDEEAIRTGLIDVFVYHGYEVEFAADGISGLDKALSGRFDLILLDVMLPGMDGFEICNRIRAQDRDQPVIMLTAKSTDEDIIQGLSLSWYCGYRPCCAARVSAPNWMPPSDWVRILKSIAGICRAGEVRRRWHLPAARWKCCSTSG